jgi:hypothetical protein
MKFITEGKISERPFHKLINDVVKNKASGVLTIQGETDTVVLYFEMGMCVNVESHYPDESIRIGQLLLKRGLLKEDQINILLEKQGTALKKIGLLAREDNLVTLNDLMNALEDQLLLIIFPCMTWKNGLFYFRYEESVPYDRESSRPVDLTPYCDFGDKILKNFNLVTQRFPDFKAIPQLMPDVEVAPLGAEVSTRSSSGHQPIMISPAQEKVYNLCNGVYTINEIIHTSHQFPWLTLSALIDLEDMNVINIPAVEKPKSILRSNTMELFENLKHGSKYLVFAGAGLIVLLMIAFLPIRLFSHTRSGAIDEIETKYSKSKMENLQFALVTYCLINSKYPEFLTEMVDRNVIRESDLLDAWDLKIYYRKSDDGFVIISEGKDKTWATEDDISCEHHCACFEEINFFPARFTGKLDK